MQFIHTYYNNKKYDARPQSIYNKIVLLSSELQALFLCQAFGDIHM